MNEDEKNEINYDAFTASGDICFPPSCSSPAPYVLQLLLITDIHTVL
jgi:hypothetical protein